MENRIKVKCLPFGEETEGGRYYAAVDGECVGENGRTHWNTKQEAKDCGFRYLVYKLNFGEQTKQKVEGCSSRQ